MPDSRVGSRQRACSRPECQRERRRRTQASWRSRNPEYFRARWLRERAALAQAAGESRGVSPAAESEPARRPSPIRVHGALRQIPWETAQDEIGVEATDLIAVVAILLVRAMQDQRRLQVLGKKRDSPTLRGLSAQDQIDPVPG